MVGRERDSFVLKYLLTITAATVSETVTFPLDTVKTRLQVSRETSGHPRNGAIRTTVSLVRKEGFLQLWAGLRPAVLRHWVYSGCRMSFYELIRDHVFKRDSRGRYPLWKALPAGMIAGAGGQFLASPMDRVKIILQVEGTSSSSPSSPSPSSPRSSGMWRTLREIVRREGVTGLWKGWVPNCQRAALVCLGDLTTYDTVKQWILRNSSLRDNALTHALSSFASGLVSATFGTPADVVKSRMMSQQYHHGNRGALYSSSLDCLTSTVRQEGFWALYKGFIPIWTRMAPWSLTFWLVYEEIRVLAGIGNF